ncbi:tellurite resistance TerB family protein [Microbulbifer agarilyticus]|uniref:tellurite resistance TerB family protein n=1 Tax=Microbulbifer agarilyticus TaxID=260552 RepID=UPI001CD38EEA|nr:TerB family tellurite resistance protein [Microbulbifer agarilyticus]MCA0899315.1 TerB family tellurite resistance protein [Microbulbifer agarilyticus]
MLHQLRKLFEQIGAGESVEVRPEKDVRMISAALMAEIATADQKVDARERNALVRLLRDHYQLDEATAEDMVERALTERNEATSLYEFTQTVNDNFSERDKYLLVKQMWVVAFADGEIDAFEEHLIRRVAELIYLPHGLFTRARAEARDESQLDAD